MTLREAIVAEALTWQNTPYHNFASVKGVGCCCVGLLVGVARAVGCLPHDYITPRYSPEWHIHKNEEMLLDVLTSLGCVEIPLTARVPGSILVFQFGRVSSHTAVLVSDHPPYIVHAARDRRRVVHQRLAGDLAQRVRQCFTFPGVPAL